MRLYYRIKKAYYDFNLQVLNRGKAKARDIFVEVSFPDELYICEKEDINELIFPQTPLPSNPLKQAEKQYEMDQAKQLNSLSFLKDEIYKSSHFMPSVLPSTKLIPNIANLSRSSWSKIEDQQITIKIESLLHTRKIEFGSFVIVPLKIGSFNVEYSIISEEMEKNKKDKISVIVE